MFECPFCLGRLPSCPDCNGTGRIEVWECPNRRVKQRHLDVCSAAVFLEMGGVMPSTGGWAEQSATFLDALVIVCKERAHYEEQRIKAASK
jgi:hypothetical protein